MKYILIFLFYIISKNSKKNKIDDKQLDCRINIDYSDKDFQCEPDMKLW